MYETGCSREPQVGDTAHLIGTNTETTRWRVNAVANHEMYTRAHLVRPGGRSATLMRRRLPTVNGVGLNPWLCHGVPVQVEFSHEPPTEPMVAIYALGSGCWAAWIPGDSVVAVYRTQFYPEEETLERDLNRPAVLLYDVEGHETVNAAQVVQQIERHGLFRVMEWDWFHTPGYAQPCAA